jgi:lipid A 3-O-deacylase
MVALSGKKILNIWVTCLITSLLLFSITSVSEARWGVNAATGWGASEILPYRVATMWSFRPINSITASNWRVFPIWETSVGYWDGEVHESKGGNDSLFAFTTGPMFRWQHEPKSIKKPSCYLEIGIAASLLSDTEISGRRLSTHFQFEDKAGVGLRFGEQQQYDMGIRVIHYSNGSIKRPNNGVNMVLLSVGYWL